MKSSFDFNYIIFFFSFCHFRAESAKKKMPVKDLFRRLQPVQLYLMLGLTFLFFVTELVVSHLTHALTLLVDSYHMLCNIIVLTGCIITIKVSDHYVEFLTASLFYFCKSWFYIAYNLTIRIIYHEEEKYASKLRTNVNYQFFLLSQLGHHEFWVLMKNYILYHNFVKQIQ